VSFNKNGRAGKVVNFSISDETGNIRIVVWDEPIINEFEKGMFKVGDIVKLKNGYSRDNRGFVEVHLGSDSQIIVNPEGEKLGEVVSSQGNFSYNKKILEEVQEGEFVSVLGTVVQIFEPRFFNVCSKCNRKVDESFNCKEHGKVEPKKNSVLNFFFDDGSSNIRVVSFGDVSKGLFDFDEQDMDNYSLDLFNVWRKEALGKQVFIEGKINKNEMFNRLEFMARNIKEADPVELLKNDV
jgi:ssDNA-binding replication factor A large subunit